MREVLKGRLRVDDAEVQIAGVLDDLYDATRRGAGPDVARRRAERRGLGADGARRRAAAARWEAIDATAADVGRRRRAATPSRSARPARRARSGWRWSAATTASGASPATPSWRDAEYAFEVTVFAPAVDAVVTNVVTDPYSLALTLNSTRSVLAELAPPAAWPKPPPRAATPRSTSCTSATSRSATRPSRPSTAAPTSRSPTPGAPACATCARSPRPG